MPLAVDGSEAPIATVDESNNEELVALPHDRDSDRAGMINGCREISGEGLDKIEVPGSRDDPCMRARYRGPGRHYGAVSVDGGGSGR